jgi:hypothetical protein
MGEYKHSARPAQSKTAPRTRAVHRPTSTSAPAVWMCPASVLMTGEQVATALYVLSDLFDDCPAPSCATVRDEVRFLVSHYGMVMIDRITAWLAGDAPAPDSTLLPGIAHCHAARPRPERLAWCRRQAQLLLEAGDG